MAQELKVIQDFYDFMLWLIGHTEKFPRHHRYSLGIAVMLFAFGPGVFLLFTRRLQSIKAKLSRGPGQSEEHALRRSHV